jgi:glyoxylase-like metal-dependent hydrolase (beta-lactamase superfamily II)
MLMVYLPQEKLLYVTDLFSPGAARQIPAFSRELFAAIERAGLAVERIVGGHGTSGTLAELRQAAASAGP